MGLNTYSEMPEVYKKEKSTIILLLDGIFDFAVGIIYVFFLRNLLINLTRPLESTGLVQFNIILFFDIIIIFEFIIACFELISVYYTKFTENKQIPKIIKKLFIITHIILIPLGGIINLIVDFILM